MNKKNNGATTDKQKVIMITILFVTTFIIMGLGIFFSIYSVANNISFKVLNSRIHGVFFGLMVFYLGLRYNLSVLKLKAEVYKNATNFSWSNFKKVKSNKAVS